MAVAASANVALAQSTFGSIVGAVEDQTGSALGQATVTVKNLDENTDQKKLSGTGGEFEFLNLKPGRYEVRVVAFLDERPISITRPIWQYTSFSSPSRCCPRSAPNNAIGTAMSTIKGRVKLSYCADRVR